MIIQKQTPLPFRMEKSAMSPKGLQKKTGAINMPGPIRVLLTLREKLSIRD